MSETQSFGGISPGLQRVAKMAREHPERAFTNLAHHITLDLMREAYRRTRKGGAVGIDGETSQEFAKDLDNRLQDLIDRAKSGRYRAPAVKRVHIPKGKGKTRPIGIPTFEDKILQRAVAMVLEAVYEEDFYDFSYGFRPGRSAHDALEAFWKGAMNRGGGWVLEADIRDFFGTLDHEHLRKILSWRIRDGVITRLIGKWLKAGILEGGSIERPESGTPQGGVISPLLANIYLHHVLDQWVEEVVKPRILGSAQLIRYADDFVILFTSEGAARKIMEVLPKRFAKYGLTLHPEKTKLVKFRLPRGDDNDSGSFDLLGFTHFWSRAKKTGQWTIKRRTKASSFRNALRRVKDWCRRNRHQKVALQHRYLCSVIRGHSGYFGITGNSQMPWKFRREVEKVWRKWLKRRSHANARKPLSWWRKLCAKYPLPDPLAIHSKCRPNVARP